MSNKRSKVFPVIVKQEVLENLQDKRLLLLFPGVFQCLTKWIKQCDRYLNTDLDNQHSATIEEFPLCLRLVCSDWNNAIEQYYQAANYPLVKKSRFLQIDTKGTFEIESQANFLCKFGQEIESLDIQVSSYYENTIAEIYVVLLQLLQNLPTLQSLSIHSDCSTQNYFELIDETINLCPFPEFIKLEYLHVSGPVSNQIINALLKKSNKLVSFKQILSDDQLFPLSYHENLSNLQELNIKITENRHFQQLKNFGKNWKLKSFRGDFSRLLDKDNWLDIFNVLGTNWSETLEELCILLPQMTYRKDFTQHMLKHTLRDRLKLSKLKAVEIWTITPISLDFLLLCKRSLESIHISWIGRPKELDNPTEDYVNTMDYQIVEHLGSEDEMEKSNIWGWFMNLRWVKSVGEVVNRPAKFGAPLVLKSI